MLGSAAGAGLSVDYSRWFRLTHALACVGFDGLGGREFPWLAFRHGKASMEYEAAERKRLRFPATGFRRDGELGDHGRARFFQ